MIITDIVNKEWNCECIGCSMGSGEITPPGGIIKETKNFVLHQDPEIPIKGFLIISTKKHMKSISELNYEETQELFGLVYDARNAMKSIDDIKEVTIIQEERAKHFHLWLLPHYDWMNEKYENSLSTVREMMRYAKSNCKTKENIQAILEAVELIKKKL